MSIEIEKIGKFFAKTEVLNNISLDIASGEMVALLGPSGSGKTTLLRIIAGLEQQSQGTLRFHGHDVSRIHAKDRRVGFVFQHYALFRHMTVFDNVAFGLTVLPRKERPSAKAIKQKVMQLLDMVQLAHLASRYPAQLSGGQKQRVALARALAVEPQILLLDEPFGALDAQVRVELRRWLRQLHEELKFTSVFVTHDQEEAMEVADRIVVMSQGAIEQVGTPNDIWQHPETRFVLEFMGEVNQLHGRIIGSQLHIDSYEFPLNHSSAHQGDVDVFLRPWDISLKTEVDEQHRLPVRVTESGPRGHFWQLTVQPLGWSKDPISVIWQNSNTIPLRGEQYFLGSQQAKIYQGKTELLFPQLAQSA
ncbi:MAG: sulfate/thiosulfate ABC transporter ATP-binding protein CysA [Providencia sp.]|uniref:sulfate/thiosulfate ABC transporter ATP-binding protein CysA n=1 Tax=Providencia sp. TaxID=589 RepID=UPI003F9B863E